MVRTRDLERHGIPRSRLARMVEYGEIDQVARGVYRLRDAPAHELDTVAAVCTRVPGAIVCLLTALHIHDIGTQAPPDVWIALDRKARKPAIVDLPVKIVRFSGATLRYGVEVREAMGVQIRVTSPARTVADCFRYRNKIGIDVALEALKDAVARRKVTVDQMVRAAQATRIDSVMRPYMEAMLA